jgi:hypothetical protein
MIYKLSNVHTLVLVFLEKTFFCFSSVPSVPFYLLKTIVLNEGPIQPIKNFLGNFIPNPFANRLQALSRRVGYASQHYL